MDVMLDFICMGPVDLPGARQNTKWKILAHSGTRSERKVLPQWTHMCNMKALSFLVRYLLQRLCFRSNKKQRTRKMRSIRRGKNSKVLLERLKSSNFKRIKNIKSFDIFDPLYKIPSLETSKQAHNHSIEDWQNSLVSVLDGHIKAILRLYVYKALHD